MRITRITSWDPWKPPSWNSSNQRTTCQSHLGNRYVLSGPLTLLFLNSISRSSLVKLCGMFLRNNRCSEGQAKRISCATHGPPGLVIKYSCEKAAPFLGAHSTSRSEQPLGDYVLHHAKEQRAHRYRSQVGRCRDDRWRDGRNADQQTDMLARPIQS